MIDVDVALEYERKEHQKYLQEHPEIEANDRIMEIIISALPPEKQTQIRDIQVECMQNKVKLWESVMRSMGKAK